MKDSPYNGMFRISPAKRKFYDKKTKLLTEHGVKEKCNFDLQNGAIYDLDGNLFKQAGQRFYNSCFFVAVFHLKINNIKDFFNYHFDYTPNKETFLDYLEFGILNDTTIDKGIKVFFQKLIDEKRKGLVEHSKNTISNEIIRKNEIAMKLIGLIGNYNNSDTVQPVYYYINDVLKEYNITPIEAKEIILQMKGSVSPLWNKNVIPFIIEHLKQIEPISKPQQSNNEHELIEIKEPTIKELALYHVYLGTKINKDNAKDFLKNTSYSSGGKLKQMFDKYTNSNNRVNKGTERENNHRKKMFKSVILMLEKKDNKEAVLKANKDLIQFEKNTA